MSTKLLDCTLRDGGYVNNWDFSFNFGKALYRAIGEASVEYIEIGYYSPKRESASLWASCNERIVNQLKESYPSTAKLAVMIDYGNVDFAAIPDARDLGVDMIRVATPKTKRREAAAFAAKLREKGYETTVNFMGISNYEKEDVAGLARLIEKYNGIITYFYIADSFGSLLPEQVFELFNELKSRTRAEIGFHAHNNIQLAFANSLEAIRGGASIIDGSIYGIGRGGGNLNLETIVAYFENAGIKAVKLLPILEFADFYMDALKERYQWGYSLPQLLSGVLQCHPKYPKQLLGLRNCTADQIYSLLQLLPKESKERFCETALSDAQKKFNIKNSTGTTQLTQDFETIRERSRKQVLILCGGVTVRDCEEKIRSFIHEKQCAVFAVNDPCVNIEIDGIFFGNWRRMLQYHKHLKANSNVIIGPRVNKAAPEILNLDNASQVSLKNFLEDNDAHFPLVIPVNSGIQAAIGFLESGYKEVYIAGLDGYLTYGQQYWNVKNELAVEDNHKQLNDILEKELLAAADFFEKMEAHLSIITPTCFST